MRLINFDFKSKKNFSPSIAESVIENHDVAPLIGSKNLQFCKNHSQTAQKIDESALNGYFSIDTWSRRDRVNGLDVIAFGSASGENLQEVKIGIFMPWFSISDRLYELITINIDEIVKTGSINDGNFSENIKISVSIASKSGYEIYIETIDTAFKCDTSGFG